MNSPAYDRVRDLIQGGLRDELPVQRQLELYESFARCRFNNPLHGAMLSAGPVSSGGTAAMLTINTTCPCSKAMLRWWWWWWRVVVPVRAVRQARVA